MARPEPRPTMGIFSHDIYENVRTRVIVLEAQRILLHPPGAVEGDDDGAWHLPGGGLEPGETLAECARREVREETGVPVAVGPVAFLREWVVPRFAEPPDAAGRHAYGLEVFLFAFPEQPGVPLRPGPPRRLAPRWVPLPEVEALPLWPKELKSLCRRLARGGTIPEGAPCFVGRFESPLAAAPADAFA